MIFSENRSPPSDPSPRAGFFRIMPEEKTPRLAGQTRGLSDDLASTSVVKAALSELD
jgi:hypothetical protein